jgi:hypothetical protein
MFLSTSEAAGIVTCGVWGWNASDQCSVFVSIFRFLSRLKYRPFVHIAIIAALLSFCSGPKEQTVAYSEH